MTGEELATFVRRICDMCDGKTDRIQAALDTLYGILERQHADSSDLQILIELKDRYGLSELQTFGKTISTISDLKSLTERARRKRDVDFAHRGCH